MASVGSLNEEALKRKERLKALRERKSTNNEENKNEDPKESADSEKLPKPVFRSYKPGSESLKDLTLNPAKPVEVAKTIKDEIEAGKTDHVITDVDLNNLAPRKPDWDLKRDISKKLDKLEKKTQKAIAELIRERLKASQDLASVVMGEALTQNDNTNIS